MALDESSEGRSNCRVEGLGREYHQDLPLGGLQTQEDHAASLTGGRSTTTTSQRDNAPSDMAIDGVGYPSKTVSLASTKRGDNVSDHLVPGGGFWGSALRMIDMAVFDAVNRVSTSDAPALSQLASTVKDAFLVALEEHHGPLSGSSSASLNSGECKRKQSTSNIQKGKQVERNNDGDDDDDSSEGDADDEDDSYRKLSSRTPGRKRVPRSKIDNICHRLLRQYLDAKGFKSKAIPEPPPLYDVNGFNHDGRGGPTLDNPKFDWLHPFTTPWNDMMAFQLANDFKASTLSSVPHGSEWDDVANLTKFITRKLNRIRQAYKDGLPPPAGSPETGQQKASRISVRDKNRSKARRRVSRRVGTFVRRGKIIEERHSEDTHLWGQIQLIHEAMGQNGMSSDETETEAHGIVPKTVRRIPKVWINEEISQMWEMVETAGRATPQPMGNTHLQRIFVASGSASGSSNFRFVIRGLPCNFYSSLWWKGLTESQQSHVKRDMLPKPIPSKDRFKL